MSPHSGRYLCYRPSHLLSTLHQPSVFLQRPGPRTHSVLTGPLYAKISRFSVPSRTPAQSRATHAPQISPELATSPFFAFSHPLVSHHQPEKRVRGLGSHCRRGTDSGVPAPPVEDPDHCTPDSLTLIVAPGHNPPLTRQAEAQLICPHTGFCQ